MNGAYSASNEHEHKLWLSVVYMNSNGMYDV